MDQRFGLDPGERDYLRKVYGEVFAMVKDLLGHASEDVTRSIYLNSRELHQAGEKPQVAMSGRGSSRLSGTFIMAA